MFKKWFGKKAPVMPEPPLIDFNGNMILVRHKPIQVTGTISIVHGHFLGPCSSRWYFWGRVKQAKAALQFIFGS